MPWTCRRCQELRPIEELGPRDLCRSCIKEKNRSDYERNREARKANALAAYYADKERRYAKIKAWRQANKAKCREYSRAWAERNPDYYLRYGAENRERLREKGRERYKANPAPYKENAKVNKGRRRGAPGYATPTQVRARFAFYGGVCAYCRSAPATHIDHVIPVVRGGSNWPANLRPACASCNLRKHARPHREWFALLERERAAPLNR